jgi:hypothetical protein
MLNQIYNEYISRYLEVTGSYNSNELKKTINKEASKAKDNYRKLANPKTCSIETYIKFWVREVLEKDLTEKEIKRMYPDNDEKDPYRKALTGFFSLFPGDLVFRAEKEIFEAPFEKRKDIWSDFKLPLTKIERKFKELIYTRNNFLATQKGYSSFIAFSQTIKKIPKADYENFIDNVDNVITYCNKTLPKLDNLPKEFLSEFGNPCYICRINPFPYKSTEDLDTLEKYIGGKYPIQTKYIEKISISFGDKTFMKYDVYNDGFQITLNKNVNFRHQSLDFIHEVCHFLIYLDYLKNDINHYELGTYQKEKEAIAKEFTILKEISPLVYKAFLGDVLGTIRRVLFELEVYNNTNQNLSKLYAKTFNRCYRGANQKENPLYLLDQRITFKPLSSLPYAVAYVELLSK